MERLNVILKSDIISFRRPTSISNSVAHKGFHSFNGFEKLLLNTSFKNDTHPTDLENDIFITIDFKKRLYFTSDCVKSFGKTRLKNLNLPKENLIYVSNKTLSIKIIFYIKNRILNIKLNEILK